MITIIVAVVLAYLLGSISSSVIFCKLWRLPDPRTCGSNNPGATNVLRIGGKTPAILTLFCDALKGAIAILIARQINILPIGLAMVMVAVFLGHLYPVFFRFQGGKGVATALGIMLAFSWPFGLLLVGVWILVVLASKISSLGAIVAAVVATVCSCLWFAHVYSSAITIIALLLLFRHKQNIKRLLTGKEPKINNGK